MRLSVSLQKHLERSAMLHSRLCPRQVLGVRMARLACTLLNVDPVVDRKRIAVYMEIGRCAADAVMVVTGASPTNGLMQLMAYGKAAASFIDVKYYSGYALRIAERPECRQLANQIFSALPPWEAQRDAYQVMDDALLFRWQTVEMLEPLPTIPEKHTTICARCGDRIGEHSEVISGGQPLCKPCAFGGYYRVCAEAVGNNRH